MASLKRLLFLGAFLISAAISSLLYAQDENTPASTAPETETVIVREQTIYIPFEDLRKTFEKNGRGVFLEYEEFRELWDAAREKDVKNILPVAAPVPFLITETVNEAKVSEEIVQVTATVRIEILQEGWKEIPLRLNDIAITKATIDGQAARLLGNAAEGYRLMYDPGKLKLADGKLEPKTLELKLEYAKTITKSPGHNSVSFEVPQAPISRWTVKIPESGVKVDFFPLIAASEETAKAAAGNPEQKEDEKAEKGTTVLAFVGPAPTVRIGWTPKSEGASGLEALTSVQLEQRATIDEGVLRTQATLDYSISRAEIERLSLQVPNDQKVIGVFDPNVRRWSINQGENSQTLEVELFEPAKDRQRIILTLEKLIAVGGDAEKDSESIEIPAIKALGVGRQQGVLVLNASNAFTTETTKVVGLMQMDREELPGTLKTTNWTYAYRLSTSEYHLSLSVEKVQPRIEAASQIIGNLSAERLNINMVTIYNIEKAGVFQLSCDIPEGFEVRGVTGFSSGDVQPAPVGTHHIGDIPAPVVDSGIEVNNLKALPPAPPMKRLTVSLSRKAIGKVGLSVILEKRLELPDLRTPTGNAVDIAIPFPLVAADSVLRREGKMIFQADECFRIVKVDPSGLKTTPIDQVRPGWVGGFPSGQLGFVYAQESANLDLRIERRKPQITIRQFIDTRIEDGLVQYTDKIYYEILYSGVKSLRIDLPEKIADRIVANGIQDTKMSPQPDDVEEGYTAWEFTGGNELSGSGTFELTWKDVLPQLELGKSVEISVPRLIPKDVFRGYGHIALSKAETIDLSEGEGNKGLRGVDPQQELPATDRRDGAAAAFEFFEDWSLNLIATRYELEELKRTSIERGLVRAVMINNSDTLSVQAVYQIRSVRQRLALEMPEGSSFDLDPRINGVAVSLELDSEGSNVRRIPLNSTTPDASFLLELRYKQPKNGGRIILPEFPDDPAVQEMYVAVYVPNDSVMCMYKGLWSPHFSHEIDTSPGAFYQTVSVVNRPDVDFVLEGFRNSTGHNVQDFSVEGKVYVFSALQPGNNGDSVLKVTTVHENTFYGVSFFLLIVFGAVLTRAKWKCRIFAIIAFSLFMLLIGICCPTYVSLYGTCSTGMPPQFEYAIGLFILLWVILSIIDCVRKVDWKNCCCFSWGKTSPTGASCPTATPTSEVVAEVVEDRKEGGKNNA